MKLFRNKEVRKISLLYVVTVVAFTIFAFMWDVKFAIFTFVLCVILFGIYLMSTYQRYKKLAELASDMNHILHGEDIGISLERYSEGEFGVLQSEIHKMANRLREQKRQLIDDKIYLADSLADISHQIRTPLTSINLVVSLLAEPNIPEERKIKLTHELLGLLSRIDWLITTLLKISKLDAGTVQLKKENISTLDLLRIAAEPLLVPIELRGQTLDICAKGTFTGDVSWTSEAIGNIIKNCMEHTQDGGHLTINAIENVLYTEIVITDDGDGIEAEDLPHIFERFYKGKNSRGQSFGIGLALARIIISKQNGTIKAENRAERGAAFTIRFYKGTV